MAAINANLLTMVEDTVTSSGVKFTSTLDGGIRVVGTATGSSEFLFSSTIGGNNKNPVKVDNGTYTLSAEGLTGSLRLITSGGGGNGFAYTELYNTSAPKVGVVSNGSKPFNYFLLRVNAGEMLDTTVYAKLEAGETATPWQPYANDTSGGGAIMSDDIITLGYNGRGGRICWTYGMLASHIGEACTLSFWARFDSDAAMMKHAAIYPYQENGIVVAKHAYGEGSNFQTVALTDEWQYFEYSGTVRQLQDIAGYSAGEMFIWSSENDGGPNIQLAGIMLTLAGGGASMSSTGRNLATNSKALDRRPEATTRDVAGYYGDEQLVERADGFTEVVTNGTWRGIGMYLNETLPQVGESYTFSANVRNDSDIAQGVIIFMMSWKDGMRVYPPFSAYWHGNPSIPPGGEKRIAYTFTWSQEAIDLLADGGNIRCTMQVANSEPRAFWAPKLEYGTAATPWRPAPEDTEQPSDLVYASEGVDLGDTSGLDTRLTTAEASITEQAGQIALKANASDVYTKQESTALLEVKANKATLTSEINASADTVKIDASRVNIEGAAIFTSGRLSQSSLDGAYDASGAASAAQAAAISAAAADATSKANAARDAAISAAATDATNKANAANAMEQLIYKSAAAGTSSMDGTTTWITSTSDTQNAWTTKRPTYSSDYPVLFVATQRKTVGGTVTCTTPIKDDTTTVIDGGHITTGTIDAARMTASVINAVNNGTGTINADKINASQLTIGQSQVTGLTNALDGKADDADVTAAINTAAADATSKANAAQAAAESTAAADATAKANDAQAAAEATAAADATAKANDAKKYATNYITEVTGGGIQVHDANDSSDYVQITSSGMDVYNDGDNVARFGSDGAQIGKSGAAHSVIDANGQRFYASDGNTQLANIGYGEGAAQSGTAVAPYYTFGKRVASGTIGNYSMCEGYSTIASGIYSHAEGSGTEASGINAHAQNLGTVAASYNQTAIGKWNVADPNDEYALIIGNGTSDNARSNALAVKWDGTVETAQDKDTVTIGDVMTAASGIAINNFHYVRRGHMAMFYFRAKPSAAKSGNWDVGTLKTGFRPPLEAGAFTGDEGHIAWILSTGEIRYRGSVAANAYVYVKATYLIA